MSVQTTGPSNKDKSVIVIGAGIIGVCSAWHLQRKGYDVTILDRKAPGEETSWGNLGLIQHLPPSAFPRTLKARTNAALNRGNDVRVRPAAVVSHLSALLQYWWASRPAPFAKIVSEYVSLVKYCTDEHEAMLRAAKAEHLVRKTGFYEVTAEHSVADLAPVLTRLRAAGVSVEAVTGAELEAREPAIVPGHFTAALFFADTWCVTDPGALVKAYAASFVSRGGAIVRTDVKVLTPPATGGQRPRGWVVHTDSGEHEAATVVVAAGPWSTELLRPLGYRLPLYPLRGYNTHFGQPSRAPALTTSLIEIDNGIGVTPLRTGVVRVTTGGELTNLGAPPDLDQLNADIPIAKSFLRLGDQVSGVWHGSRPCLPDMKPAIGAMKHHTGLYFAGGHAGNGMTLSAVTGRLLSELIHGDAPFVDPTPFDPNRFF